jgi:23S rRNA pseudouridine1911/1915/1917 synthase
VKTFVVKQPDQGKRLDVFLADKLPNLSRSFIQTLCDAKKIKLNGSIEPSKTRLNLSDKVKVDFDEKSINSHQKIDLPIIYEDRDVLVIDKPAGVLTHSKGAFNPEATVATFIAPKLKRMSGERAGIVHRLDRPTSGVVITAKNVESQKWLQKQFSNRKVKKTYIAIVEGALEPTAAIIDMPIERNPKNPQSFRVGSGGRPAKTEYKTIKSGNNYSLVELKPATGRTHQLRVHLKQLKHPIIGDKLYEGKPADRLYLHAVQLEITLPNKERKVFKSDLPKEFNKIVNNE